MKICYSSFAGYYFSYPIQLDYLQFLSNVIITQKKGMLACRNPYDSFEVIYKKNLKQT